MPLPKIGTGVGAAHVQPEGEKARGCVTGGTVVKYPLPIAPSSITLDEVFVMNGSLYGGDWAGLGQPGVPVKNHEIIATSTAAANGTGGEVLDAWNLAVLTDKPIARNCTLTTAQHTAIGGGAQVKLWLRSYDCDGDWKEDVAQTTVNP